jgi:sulfur-oxidizing protein SoxY
MNEPNRIGVVDRRDFLLGGSAAAAVLGFITSSVQAQQTPVSAPPVSGVVPAPPGTVPAAQVTWQDAMRAMIGSAQPVEGRISLELPDTAENGNVVPFTITIDSPMTEQDFVKAVHIFSTANPKPDVASAYFSRLSGKAVFSSRMRLGRSQDVVAVAEMSDGKVYLGKRTVKVTIGGCGTG